MTKNTVPFGGDFNSRAVEFANHFRETRMDSHRAVEAFDDSDRYLVAFGNDCYSKDERAQLEVTLFRQMLDDYRVTEVAFGLSTQVDDAEGNAGYSWCMILQASQELLDEHADVREQREWLEEALWNAWFIATGSKPLGN